jgi:ubiquinone/menaquinone biosynthesis C-methylase UbiE
MTTAPELDFGKGNVARSYDDVLVPLIFRPWGERLLDEHGPWDGRTVLDLATGTGVVARLLADRVGPNGKVIAADINPQMLNIAKDHCADAGERVRFVESSAHPLELEGGVVDAVICQQGFQFFPDRAQSAVEILRVLRDEGVALVSTWCSVAECKAFGAICGALDAIGETELANMMRRPFDHLPEDELQAHFEDAGFDSVELQRHEALMTCDGGPKSAVELALATPIGPHLRELAESVFSRFTDELSDRATELSRGESHLGKLVSNVIVARK